MTRILVSLLAIITFAPAQTIQYQSINLETALGLVQAAIKTCSDEGFSIAATVVDRSGEIVAVGRADDAGVGTVDGSRAKAYTSLALGQPTSVMAQVLVEQPGFSRIADIPGFLILPGGVPIIFNNAVVGGLGVGGATSDVDERCASMAIKELFEP